MSKEVERLVKEIFGKGWIIHDYMLTPSGEYVGCISKNNKYVVFHEEQEFGMNEFCTYDEVEAKQVFELWSADFSQEGIT